MKPINCIDLVKTTHDLLLPGPSPLAVMSNAPADDAANPLSGKGVMGRQPRMSGWLPHTDCHTHE